MDCGVDLKADQLGPLGQPLHPRLWKSHQRLAAVNPGCKYIVTLREPGAVASSYYHFYREKGLTGESSLDEWTAQWADSGTW